MVSGRMCAPPNKHGIGKRACADAQREEKERRTGKKEGKKRNGRKERKVKREREIESMVAVYRMRPVYVRSFALQP